MPVTQGSNIACHPESANKKHPRQAAARLSAVLRILSVLGFDRLVNVFPSLAVALTSSSGWPSETTR